MSSTSDNLTTVARLAVGIFVAIAIVAALERHHLDSPASIPVSAPSASSSAADAAPPASASATEPEPAMPIQVSPPIAPDAHTLVLLSAGTWESEIGVKLRVDPPRKARKKAAYHLVVEREAGGFGCDFDEGQVEQVVGFDRTFVAWCGGSARSRANAVALHLDGRTLRLAVLKDMGTSLGHPTAVRHLDLFFRRPDAQ